MTDNAHNRARQPFHVRPHRDGFAIPGGPTEHDATLGVVFDNGQPDPEELAKIWAAAQSVMFPALAQSRNEERAILNAGRADIPADITDALRRIEQTAASALPVPTIGDLNGTSPLPPAPEAATTQPADVSDPLARIETIASEMGHADTLGFEEARDRILEVIAAARSVAPAPMAESLGEMMRPHLETALRSPPPVSSQQTEMDGHAELRALMRDPRYWRERDPAVIARASEGFRRVYPGTTPPAASGYPEDSVELVP